MTVNYTSVDQLLGEPPLTVAGDTTQRIALGHIIYGRDATYGIAEFIYTKFTGTVAAGDFVLLDQAGLACVQAAQAVKATFLGSLCGVSMAAQSAGTYGYVMVRGVHDGANVASGVTANTQLGLSTTAGRAAATSTGFRIDNATEKLVTASVGNLGTVALVWSTSNGNG